MFFFYIGALWSFRSIFACVTPLHQYSRGHKVKEVTAFPGGQCGRAQRTCVLLWLQRLKLLLHVFVCACVGNKPAESDGWLWPLLIWLLPPPPSWNVCTCMCQCVRLPVCLTACGPVIQESCWQVKWQIGKQRLWRGRWKRAGRQRGGGEQRGAPTGCETGSLGQTEKVQVYRVYIERETETDSRAHISQRREAKRLLRRSDWQNAEEEKSVIWWIWMVCCLFVECSCVYVRVWIACVHAHFWAHLNGIRHWVWIAPSVHYNQLQSVLVVTVCVCVCGWSRNVNFFYEKEGWVECVACSSVSHL